MVKFYRDIDRRLVESSSDAGQTYSTGISKLENLPICFSGPFKVGGLPVSTEAEVGVLLSTDEECNYEHFTWLSLPV